MKIKLEIDEGWQSAKKTCNGKLLSLCGCDKMFFFTLTTLRF